MNKQLHNPFKTLETDIKMKVWHRGHELCEAEFGYKNCKKDTIIFRIPHIIETKIDDFCQRHQRTLDNEHHRLPSGKTIWLGCPVCQRNNTAFRQKKDFIIAMKDAGMMWNEEKDEFFMPGEPGGDGADKTKTRSTGFRR